MAWARSVTFAPVLAHPLKSPTPASTPLGVNLVLPGEREADVVAFEGQMVDFFVSAADLLGVPKSVAAIYGIVFASPTPLSFAEIEARLDISKGSVSQGLRVLREIGALKEVSGPEDRAELFAPDLELRKLVARFIERRLELQLRAGSERLGTLSRQVPRWSSADTQEMRRRLKSLSAWHSKAQALLPVARAALSLGR